MADKKARPNADTTGDAAEVASSAGDPSESGPPVMPAAVANERQSAPEAVRKHLAPHLGESDLMGLVAQHDMPVACQQLKISLLNLRANSKAFVIIRDDQAAIWSEGDGTGLVGLSFSTSRDPALYVRNFLINAREFYVQTYNTCQEITVSLYVRTAQPLLRGRVDVPPGATVTLQSSRDRTSLVGLSSFAIDF